MKISHNDVANSAIAKLVPFGELMSRITTPREWKAAGFKAVGIEPDNSDPAGEAYRPRLRKVEG